MSELYNLAFYWEMQKYSKIGTHSCLYVFLWNIVLLVCGITMLYLCLFGKFRQMNRRVLTVSRRPDHKICPINSHLATFSARSRIVVKSKRGPFIGRKQVLGIAGWMRSRAGKSFYGFEKLWARVGMYLICLVESSTIKQLDPS